jgi:autotransporter-associated beta strand protein
LTAPLYLRGLLTAEAGIRSSPTRRMNCPMKKAILPIALLISLFCAAESVQATTLYWSGGGSVVGGAGTWNTTAAHFGTSTSGPFTTVWANANTDDAIFTASGSAPGGVVSVGAAITMKGTLQWEQTPGTFPNYTFNGASTITFNPGSTLNAVTTGTGTAGSMNCPYAGTITKIGTAQCTFNNANGNVTKFIINQGTADFASFNRFGTGGDVPDFLTFNGGTMRMNTTTAWTMGRSITINTNSLITGSSTTITLTQDKPITWNNNATLTISVVPVVFVTNGSVGTGTLTLSTATTCNAANVIPTTVRVNQSSTFTMNNNSQSIKTFSGAGAINLGSGTLTINNPAGETASGVISGSGNITKLGTGTWTISNAGNTFSGNTTVSAGVLKLGAAGSAGASMVIVAAGARLDANSISPTLTALSGSGTVINNAGNTVTVNGNLTTGGAFNQYSCFSGVITNGSLTKDGSHAMALRGANTWDGSLSFNNGTLSVGAAPDRIPTTTALSVPGSGIFQLDANSQGISSLSGNGQVNLGGGTLSVFQTGANTFSGSIQNSELVGSSTATGHGLRGYYYDNLDFTALKAVRDDATVNFSDLTSAAQLPAAIYPNTNQVSVRWLGQVLTTTNGTYTFTTTCDDGSRLWVNGTLIVDNWILQGATAKSGTVTLAADTRYDIVMEFFNNAGGSSAKLSWTPPGDTTSVTIPTEYLFLPGPGALVKSGPDQLTLNTVNTYSGGTTVNAGTLDVSTDGALGTGNVAVADPAMLTLELGATNGYIASSADLLLSGGGPTVNLNFTGTNYIHALSYDGGSTYQPAGVYGPAGSGATYENSRFGGSGTGYLTVTATPSTNVLTTSGSPAVYGSSLNFTSTVTGGAGIPTGTVSFYEAFAGPGNFLGTAPLNGAGIAVLTINHLSAVASPHFVTAVYSGDTTYATSTSGAVPQAIAAASLTPSVTISNKVYDATTNASVASVSFGGIHTLDSNYVHLAGTVLAFFQDPNVGTNKPVDISGLALAGSLAGNYTLATTTGSATANISVRGLTVTNITANSRVYDGTTNATISGSGALSGVIPGDTVTLGGTPVASFATRTVGTNKVVTVNGYTLSGAQTGNYSPPVPTLTANITAALATVVGLTANSKVYDGTNTATLSGTASLSNIVSGDVVTLGGTPTATFNNKNAGVAKPVTVTGYTDSGADVANYVLSQPVGLTADITAVGTTVLLTSSPNPSSLTSNVVFAVTVTANSPTLDSPGGASSIILQTNGTTFLPLVTPIASAPGSSTNGTSTTLLKAGANTVTAQYGGDGLNYAPSPVVTITQTVNSATCAATNKLLGITANLDGTLTLNFLGTHQAQYYVVASTNVSAAIGTWTVLADSTNSVTNVSGFWSYTTTNGLPRRFYRGAAVVPCP